MGRRADVQEEDEVHQHLGDGEHRDGRGTLDAVNAWVWAARTMQSSAAPPRNIRRGSPARAVSPSILSAWVTRADSMEAGKGWVMMLIR